MTARHKIHGASSTAWSFATESRHLPVEITLGTEIDEFDERMRFASLCDGSRLNVIAALGIKYASILGLPLLAIMTGAELVARAASM